MRTTFETLQLAERFETLAAELYGQLSARFAANPDAKALLRRLSDEEIQHAARIRLLAAQYRNDPRLFGGAAGLRDVADPMKLVLELDAAVREVAAGGWGDELAPILERLASCEDRASAFHAELLARGGDPSIVRFFEELARQDREHLRLLEAAGTGR
jgi:rubrerythrin